MCVLRSIHVHLCVLVVHALHAHSRVFVMHSCVPVDVHSRVLVVQVSVILHMCVLTYRMVDVCTPPRKRCERSEHCIVA